MKCCRSVPRTSLIGALALILVVTASAFKASSAEPLDFPALDRALHSLITNRETSDSVLLQAISRLGPVKERPSFWWSILDDTSYPLRHRTRALYALFRRHAGTRYAASDLTDVLGAGKWFRDATLFQVTYVFGSLPVEVNDGESVFRLTVFGTAHVYIRVLGHLDEKMFEKALRDSRSGQAMDPVIIHYGYEDDYDYWYYTQPKYSVNR